MTDPIWKRRLDRPSVRAGLSGARRRWLSTQCLVEREYGPGSNAAHAVAESRSTKPHAHSIDTVKLVASLESASTSFDGTAATWLTTSTIRAGVSD
jgi:hypothetical protein